MISSIRINFRMLFLIGIDKNKGYQYNVLNLPYKVGTRYNGRGYPETNRFTHLATYKWLLDGTKTGVVTADSKSGFEYLGSLVYKRRDGALSLESAGFGSGRTFPVVGGGFTSHYHIADHIGSTRVVFNQSGQVLETNDYYPFGGRIENPASQMSDNRYRFSGKEDQVTGDLDLVDFGARMLKPAIGRWMTSSGREVLQRKSVCLLWE